MWLAALVVAPLSLAAVTGDDAAPGAVDDAATGAGTATDDTANAADDDDDDDDDALDDIPLVEETVVTATRLPRPVSSLPQTVVVLPRAELERSPALTLDETLRTVPSAATFRRSSSRSADPSSQGLNLRGLGPSGASRALVLVDGVPQNDPFGGQVYWRALPRLSIARIEIVPGGGSALWGSAALGGVVNVDSRDDVALFDADAAVGSSSSGFFAVRGADDFGAVTADVAAEFFGTAGAPVVAAAARGAVDGAAPSSHGNVAAHAGVDLGAIDVDVRAGGFHEDQSGGTRFTTAAVDQQRASVSLRGFGLDVVGFARGQEFRQHRARVDDLRNDETPAAEQVVPAHEVGAGVVYAHDVEFVGDHVVSAGADVRRVVGESDETLHRPDGSTGVRRSGGEQRFAGLFVQDLWTPLPFLDLQAGARVDVVDNVAGFFVSTDKETTFAPRTDLALSPQAGVVLRPFPGLALRASGGRSFRAPTLNELYRPFQVGTVLTAANPALVPEQVWSVDGGFVVTALPGLALRTTAFWNLLEDPVVNATLAAPLSDGAQRQRQNLGAARVQGLELAADWRIDRRFTLLAAVTAVDAVVVAADDVALVGKQLPQDPALRGVAALSFDEPRLFGATLQLRGTGQQYEDDQNTLPLGPALVVDVALRRRLLEHLELVVSVENATNAVFVVGRAGVDTVGEPFFALVGLRFRS